jgi:hypothetical protein
MSSFVHGLGVGNGEQPLWELAAATTNTPVTVCIMYDKFKDLFTLGSSNLNTESLFTPMR